MSYNSLVQVSCKGIQPPVYDSDTDTDDDEENADFAGKRTREEMGESSSSQRGGDKRQRRFSREEAMSNLTEATRHFNARPDTNAQLIFHLSLSNAAPELPPVTDERSMADSVKTALEFTRQVYGKLNNEAREHATFCRLLWTVLGETNLGLGGPPIPSTTQEPHVLVQWQSVHATLEYACNVFVPMFNNYLASETSSNARSASSSQLRPPKSSAFLRCLDRMFMFRDNASAQADFSRVWNAILRVREPSAFPDSRQSRRGKMLVYPSSLAVPGESRLDSVAVLGVNFLEAAGTAGASAQLNSCESRADYALYGGAPGLRPPGTPRLLVWRDYASCLPDEAPARDVLQSMQNSALLYTLVSFLRPAGKKTPITDDDVAAMFVEGASGVTRILLNTRVDLFLTADTITFGRERVEMKGELFAVPVVAPLSSSSSSPPATISERQQLATPGDRDIAFRSTAMFVNDELLKYAKDQKLVMRAFFGIQAHSTLRVHLVPKKARSLAARRYLYDHGYRRRPSLWAYSRHEGPSQVRTDMLNFRTDELKPILKSLNGDRKKVVFAAVSNEEPFSSISPTALTEAETKRENERFVLCFRFLLSLIRKSVVTIGTLNSWLPATFAEVLTSLRTRRKDESIFPKLKALYHATGGSSSEAFTAQLKIPEDEKRPLVEFADPSGSPLSLDQPMLDEIVRIKALPVLEEITYDIANTRFDAPTLQSFLEVKEEADGQPGAEPLIIRTREANFRQWALVRGGAGPVDHYVYSYPRLTRSPTNAELRSAQAGHSPRNLRILDLTNFETVSLTLRRVSIANTILRDRFGSADLAGRSLMPVLAALQGVLAETDDTSAMARENVLRLESQASLAAVQGDQEPGGGGGGGGGPGSGGGGGGGGGGGRRDKGKGPVRPRNAGEEEDTTTPDTSRAQTNKEQWQMVIDAFRAPPTGTTVMALTAEEKKAIAALASYINASYQSILQDAGATGDSFYIDPDNMRRIEELNRYARETKTQIEAKYRKEKENVAAREMRRRAANEPAGRGAGTPSGSDDWIRLYENEFGPLERQITYLQQELRQPAESLRETIREQTRLEQLRNILSIARNSFLSHLPFEEYLSLRSKYEAIRTRIERLSGEEEADLSDSESEANERRSSELALEMQSFMNEHGLRASDEPRFERTLDMLTSSRPSASSIPRVYPRSVNSDGEEDSSDDEDLERPFSELYQWRSHLPVPPTRQKERQKKEKSRKGKEKETPSSPPPPTSSSHRAHTRSNILSRETFEQYVDAIGRLEGEISEAQESLEWAADTLTNGDAIDEEETQKEIDRLKKKLQRLKGLFSVAKGSFVRKLPFDEYKALRQKFSRASTSGRVGFLRRHGLEDEREYVNALSDPSYRGETNALSLQSPPASSPSVPSSSLAMQVEEADEDLEEALRQSLLTTRARELFPSHDHGGDEPPRRAQQRGASPDDGDETGEREFLQAVQLSRADMTPEERRAAGLEPLSNSEEPSRSTSSSSAQEKEERRRRKNEMQRKRRADRSQRQLLNEKITRRRWELSRIPPDNVMRRHQLENDIASFQHILTTTPASELDARPSDTLSSSTTRTAGPVSTSISSTSNTTSTSSSSSSSPAQFPRTQPPVSPSSLSSSSSSTASTHPIPTHEDAALQRRIEKDRKLERRREIDRYRRERQPLETKRDTILNLLNSLQEGDSETRSVLERALQETDDELLALAHQYGRG